MYHKGCEVCDIWILTGFLHLQKVLRSDKMKLSPRSQRQLGNCKVREPKEQMVWEAIKLLAISVMVDFGQALVSVTQKGMPSTFMKVTAQDYNVMQQIWFTHCLLYLECYSGKYV